MTHPHKESSSGIPPLRLVFWETTAGCNLACVHCRRLDVAETLCKNDLNTAQAKAFITTLPEICPGSKPILVLSGGEPLMRPDIYDLADHARSLGVPTALATNGTLVDDIVAQKIVDAGVRRVSISFDGPDPETHDGFRGISGAFTASVAGFKYLKERGMSMQINTTLARHNYHKLNEMYQLALTLGADALHIFMLVPVGCGVELNDNMMLSSEEYETALNWVYDRSVENKLQLKATCAPHYFRIVRQRNKEAGIVISHPTSAPTASGHPHGEGGGDLNLGHSGVAHGGGTKGCLAGQAVCFVSHQGDVFPCGYLPVSSGNIKDKGLPAIWRDSQIFQALRDDSGLEGKCGCCEYKKVCMGCRARAYAETHNYLAEEPNCGYVPIVLKK